MTDKDTVIRKIILGLSEIGIIYNEEEDQIKIWRWDVNGFDRIIILVWTNYLAEYYFDMKEGEIIYNINNNYDNNSITYHENVLKIINTNLLDIIDIFENVNEKLIEWGIENELEF